MEREEAVKTLKEIEEKYGLDDRTLHQKRMEWCNDNYKPVVCKFSSSLHWQPKNDMSYDAACGKEVLPDVVPHRMEAKKPCKRCMDVAWVAALQAIPDEEKK